MRSAQFTSPLIILLIIIMSTLILSVQAKINMKLETDAKDYGIIINQVEEENNKQIQYETNLTHKVLKLLSTINSSGTINSLLESEKIQITGTEPNVIVEYENKGKNKTILIPYPYAELVRQEQRFNTETFKTCMQESCNNLETCTNAYDTGTIDWEPIVCLNMPLRVKISIKDAEYPLTKDFNYLLWNNSYKIIT